MITSPSSRSLFPNEEKNIFEAAIMLTDGFSNG